MPTSVRPAALVCLVLWLGGCGEPQSPETQAAEGNVSFTVGELAYQVDTILFRNAELEVFGVMDIAKAGGDYVVIDAANHRLMFYSQHLDHEHKSGREGEGPGEYGFPWMFASNGNRLAVLDGGLGRVSYLSPRGDLLSSQQVHAGASDIALHPTLGLLVAEAGSPVHYLRRYDGGKSTALAAMPAWFVEEGERWRTDLVAVTEDGSVHVFDGHRLALVSYTENGTLEQVAFLPKEVRDAIRARLRRSEGAFGNRVLVSQIHRQLKDLSDGRVFLRMTHGRALGYMLDPGSLEATPVLVPLGQGLDWMLNGMAYLELDRGRYLHLVVAYDEEMVVARMKPTDLGVK